MNVKEIRDKSNTELLQEIESLKEELFNLRFQQAIRPAGESFPHEGNSQDDRSHQNCHH